MLPECSLWTPCVSIVGIVYPTWPICVPRPGGTRLVLPDGPESLLMSVWPRAQSLSGWLLLPHRLCTATCVAGGTISSILRAGNQVASRTAAAPKGDILLAAALSAAAISATHFQTTKRATGQRRELIRQSDGRSYTQQAAALSSVAERVRSDAVLGEATALGAPVLHNLRDSRRRAPQQQAPSASPASTGSWYFNLALQSSLL